MIKNIRAREILDSRGNPTVEVSLFSGKGTFVSSVPSGASTGSYEAKELRDGGERYNGKGVLKAVENVNNVIAPLLQDKEIEPEVLDNLILEKDGTKDKSSLGANAILGVSMCLYRAAAKEKEQSLFSYISVKNSFEKSMPTPCFNLINGGAHGSGGGSFQEFMVVSEKNTFSKNLEKSVAIFARLKQTISKKYGPSSLNIGDEGGLVPTTNSTEEILGLFDEILKSNDTSLLIDVAATEFFTNGFYNLDSAKKTKEEMIDFYEKIIKDNKIIGLEDPLEEGDFEGWSDLLKKLPDIMVVGDDLLTTNTERMRKAKERNACNAMILKINQIGTVTEAIKAVKLAKEYNWKIIVSHRSGETNDDFIADFAVGIGADYIKAGAPQRGERVAKYNRLLQIEKLLNI
jgi:enolase